MKKTYSFVFAAILGTAAAVQAKKPVEHKPATKAELEEALPFELSDFDEAQKALAKKAGPAKTATQLGSAWYYNPKKSGSNTSCDSIQLVRTPQGHAIARTGIMNGDPCTATKLTKKQVEDIRPKEGREMSGTTAEQTVAYDATLKSFETKLGKGQSDPMFTEVRVATFQYVNDDNQCKYVALVAGKNSTMFDKVWDLDCK